jgi:hypothetical protein
MKTEERIVKNERRKVKKSLKHLLKNSYLYYDYIKTDNR